MAVGETASGKSTSLLLIKKLLGGTLISQSSGESIMSKLVKSSYPVYWDDPTHPNTLRKVHVSTLQGGGKQTKGGGHELPRTTFIMTVNFTLDEDMRQYQFLFGIIFFIIIAFVQFSSMLVIMQSHGILYRCRTSYKLQTTLKHELQHKLRCTRQACYFQQEAMTW